MAMDEDSPARHPAAPSWLRELIEVGRAFRRLLGAQRELLRAEFGLARSAVWWMLVASLVAVVAGVGFGLSMLALVGMALAQWWGSWLWALLALVVLQLLCLLAATVVFRRCLGWLTLPHSRAHCARLWRGSLRPLRTARGQAESAPPAPDTESVR